jgi:predicted RNA-binding Zn ribbon-like protein
VFGSAPELDVQRPGASRWADQAAHQDHHVDRAAHRSAATPFWRAVRSPECAKPANDQTVTGKHDIVGYMALEHPVDGRGRVLPDSAWPADKAAPGRWDVIRRFCNTANRESGADRFESERDLQRWLETHEYRGATPSSDDRSRIVAFRELVRSHALAHHDITDDAGLDTALARHVEGVELTLVVRKGQLETVPAPSGAVDQVVGTVAIAIMAAQREDCWKRFKACPHCEWVFYDRSKNQSGRWCSMNACGGRAKVAAFREREKGPTR